jgi:hypothetical protein
MKDKLLALIAKGKAIYQTHGRRVLKSYKPGCLLLILEDGECESASDAIRKPETAERIVERFLA